MALVFQYGSNTLSARLNSPERLCGDAKDLGLVRTEENFELHFNVWSRGNNCAAADLKRGSGRPIWGVLYDVPDGLIARDTAGNRKSMDAIEGSKYRRGPISVLRENGTRIEDLVLTYTVINPKSGLRTSLTYAAHIIRGLRGHAAPNDYLNYVKDRVVANNPQLAAEIEDLTKSAA
jgi:hypothetical protein